MRAMILSAGRGQRMRPLTDECPKALLAVNHKPLIVYHIEALQRAGIKEIVINLGHLGQKIKETLGGGEKFGVDIQYSWENPILETAGGIIQALPLLGDKPFIAVSADIFTDYPFERLPKEPQDLIHLVLTDNPPHHKRGDFALSQGKINETDKPLYNFAGIGVYRKELFKDYKPQVLPLYPFYKKAIEDNQISGEYYAGLWHNIGTPEQLSALNQEFLKAI